MGPRLLEDSHVYVLGQKVGCLQRRAGKINHFNDNKYLEFNGTIIDEIIDHSHLRTWEPPFDVAKVQYSLRFGLD